MLIALTCATRTQTIILLSVNNVHKLSSEFVIKIEGLLKQSRTGYSNPQIHLKAYPPAEGFVFLLFLKNICTELKICVMTVQSY